MPKGAAARKSANRRAPKLVPFKLGDKVDLGGGSFSDLLITNSTVSKNKAMMGYSVFKPGTNTKQKIHISKEELAYILSGSGKLTVGKKDVSFKESDSLFIPAGVPHGVKNDGDKDVVMVFFFASPSYPKTVDA